MIIAQTTALGKRFLKRKWLLLLSFTLLYLSVFAQTPVANFTASVVSGCAPLKVDYTDASTGSPTEWLWDLGNGTVSTNPGSASAIYTFPGIYTVKLQVKNAFGEDSITKVDYITVYAKPTVNFSASPTTGCIPLVVNFVDSSNPGSGTIQNWVWDFGDGGSPSIDQNPTHTYISGGSYNVSLFVVNSFGCQQSIITTALINPADSIHADFNYNYTNICNPPTLVDFTNITTPGTGLLYSWDFGNGSGSNVKNPSQIYNSTGSYTVRLIADNGKGCADTITKAISIGNVQAGFSLPQGVCVNEPAVMSDSSSPVAVSATWDFGDGQTGTGLTVTHTYDSVGSYIVTYSANFGGCNSIISKTINVTDKPKAAFSSSSVLTSCTAPLTVQFDNSSTNATNYIWDFGDGSTSTLNTPEHTYTVSGVYTVTLIAISPGGCSDTLAIPKFVRINQPRIYGFTNLPFTGCAPATITMRATIGSPDPVVSYLWDFGDGSTSSVAVPTHTYDSVGTYKVTLSVTTNTGCSTSYTLNSAVVLSPKPVAKFTASPLNVCASQEINFTDQSTGNVDAWLWSFGDGSTGSAQNPVYHYMDTGYFDVKLIVYSNGCSDTAVHKKYVYVAPPVAAFNVLASCDTPFQKSFQDASVAAQSWNWNFGDGFTSPLQNPQHVYSSNGLYNVQLIVKNGACADTIINSTYVIKQTPSFTATPLSSNFCKYDSIQFVAQNIDTTYVAGIRWMFGDYSGTIFSKANDTATHKYADTGSYNVKMIINDINGCYDTTQLATPIKILGPKASFTNNLGTCVDTLFAFTDLSTTDGIHPINKWDWDFGDGTVVSLPGSPFTHRYADSGTYNVQLKVYDTNGCYDSIFTSSAVIIGKPSSDFTVLDSLRCTSSSVGFTEQALGVGLKYNWNFGDGTNGNGAAVNHFYLTEGTYSVTLTVVDTFGCTAQMIKPASVTISNPLAAFTVSDSAARCTLPVQATSQSQNYNSLSWDFGDGATSILDNPFHLYTVPGVYQLQLIAKGYGECYDTAYHTVELRGPYGTFNFTNNDGCFPLTVSFNATATSTVSYIWDFGDGSSNVTPGNSTTYTYTTPGIFVPILLLQDSSGCRVAIQSSDTAFINGVKPKFFFNAAIGCDSSLVSFTDSSYIIASDPMTSVSWDFGDGGTSSLSKPVHFYKSTGTYLVRQTVNSLAGCVATYTLPVDISVNKAPKLLLTAVDSACVNSNIVFDVSDTANVGPLQWLWDLGNGNQTSTQNLTYIYPTSAIYSVSVTGTDATTGCADTAYHGITILDLPPVYAGVDTSICLNTIASLNASGAVTYQWINSPSLSCNNCSNPLAAPNSTTTYYVTGKDNFGCAATDSVIVTVVKPTKISLSTNSDTLCLGSSLQLIASGAEKYSWQPPTGLSNPNIGNPVASPDISTVYTVIGSDNISCFADTMSVSILVAPLPTFDITDTAVTINVGSSYTITTTSSPDVIAWAWDPATGLNASNVGEPVASPKTNTIYTGTATNQYGCSVTDNIRFEVLCNNSNVYIPNTFSPNGDGNNEYFLPRGKGLYSIKSMKIFNRWGVPIFERWNFAANTESRDAAWDGTYQGKPQPSDVYVYVIDIICENGSVLTYKGNVTLIR